MTQTDPSAPLRDAQHELFAQRLASGMSQAEAYREAGYADDRRNAARLMTKDDVRARVEWLKRKAASDAEFSRAAALGVLRDIALDRGAPHSSRVSAVAQAAKMEAWNAAEKHEVGVGGPLAELLARLRA